MLIDFVNGRSQQITQLHRQGVSIFTNPVIELELLQGARDKTEMQQLDKKLRMFHQLDMPRENCQVARELIKVYALSHGLRLADALIAATALVYELKLFTLNVNDFKFIPDVTLYRVSNS
ncbi:MAG: type II toxin-antitoxin system VapC family toxin [Gammaproteobacteria bacterium]|nr:type II toxin-antitoxin system VapC family toxin [Gammaproteobacteria bacterium]